MAKKARKKAKPAKAAKAKGKAAVKKVAKKARKAAKVTKAKKKKAPAKAAVKAKTKTKAKRAPAKAGIVKTAKKAASRLVAAAKRAVGQGPVKAPKKKKEVIGEGNYTAARNFRKAETDFIDNNRATISRKAKEAEAAIDGPEGADLEEARIETAAHAHGTEE
jgi:hypothetical protein